MPQPTHDLQETEAAISNVIQSLTDSQEALVEIGEKIENPTLKRYFLAESLKRAQFRGELESILNQEGVSDLRESGSSAEKIEHIWAGLRFKFGGGDHTLLATAEEGEGAASEVYESAMNADLPLPIRQLLTAQAAHIQMSHDFVKAARDRTGEDKHAA
jgi:uncharacterized protein (TIGR02284 family)